MKTSMYRLFEMGAQPVGMHHSVSFGLLLGILGAGSSAFFVLNQWTTGILLDKHTAEQNANFKLFTHQTMVDHDTFKKEMKAELDTFKKEMKAEFVTFKKETKAEFDTFKKETAASFHALDAKLDDLLQRLPAPRGF